MAFPQIDPERLYQRRSAYSYPSVALAGSLDSPLSRRFETTIAMDTYLNELLSSPDDAQKVLGYLGVVYWGHFSGLTGRDTASRAMGKVRMAYSGVRFMHKGRPSHRQGVVDIGLDNAARYLAEARTAVMQDDYSRAITVLQDNLPQLKVAFASKVCAFLAPNKCGVIDSAIADQYPQMGFHRDASGYIKSSRQNLDLYQQYCVYLQGEAQRMNGDAHFARWRDRDGSMHAWRAVDIERGLYQAA